MKRFLATVVLASSSAHAFACVDYSTRAEAVDLSPGFFAIAEPVSTSLTALPHRFAAGELIWEAPISRCGAASLSARVVDLHLPAGWRLEVETPDGVVEPYSTELPHLNTWPIAGSDMTLRLIGPQSSSGEVRGRLAEVHIGVPSRAHLSPVMTANSAKVSGNANVNFSCKAQEQPELAKFGDGVIIYVVGGVALCTGALINHPEAGERPWMMTATHCPEAAAPIATANVAEEQGRNGVARLGAQAACGADINGQPTVQSEPIQLRKSIYADYGDVDLVSTPYTNDIWVVEMEKYPAYPRPIFLYGYTFDTPEIGDPVLNIHHGTGRPQQWSLGVVTQILRSHDPLSDGITLGTRTRSLLEVDYIEGCLDGGSSGSPMFTPDGLILGPLSRGSGENCASNPSDLAGESDRKALRDTLPGQSREARFWPLAPTPAPVASPVPTPAPSTAPPPPTGGEGSDGGGALGGALILILCGAGFVRRRRG